MSTTRITELELVHCPVTAKTTWSFIRLGMSDGAVGWGEASWVRHPAALDGYLQRARERWLGESGQTLEESLAAPTAMGTRMEMPMAAVTSALEQAMWDLRGKRAGLFSAALGGEACRDPVPLYANINRSISDRSPSGFAHAGAKALAAGFTRIKIAPFDGLTPDIGRSAAGRKLLEEGLARVAATRTSIGATAELYVDCHWRFDLAGALAILADLAALGVSWFECPLLETPAAIPDLKMLRSRAHAHGMRLAGLEELTHPQDFLPWLSAGAYDVVMPDVKYAQGIGGVGQVAELAARHGATCAPHNPSGPIAHAASLVVCAMHQSIEQLEHQFDETEAFWRMTDDAFPRPQSGASRLSSLPGLGTSLRLPVTRLNAAHG